jgi:hypothetical protein
MEQPQIHLRLEVAHIQYIQRIAVPAGL